MEGDHLHPLYANSLKHFNPLPPHGGRHTSLTPHLLQFSFQSTPSAWRETTQPRFRYQGFPISIHSLRMEGDHIHFATGELFPVISIHSLRMEGDSFQTLFLRCIDISIHSLRMEGDAVYGTTGNHCLYFNPLPPHGGRQGVVSLFGKVVDFNPLPPHGGRRLEFSRIEKVTTFQSTPSAWRETGDRPKYRCTTSVFQSTPSAWRET